MSTARLQTRDLALDIGGMELAPTQEVLSAPNGASRLSLRAWRLTRRGLTMKHTTLALRRTATDGPLHSPNATLTKRGRLLATQTIHLPSQDISVRYAELGDSARPTVLLLHGVPENLHAWYAVAPLLAKDYHVVALDWPGFGGSDALASADQYTSRSFARVIIALMDALGIRRASLVASDIGLLPSFLVALAHPKRVARLAVMGGIPFPRPQHTSWELKSFARKGSLIARALVRWFPRLSTKITHIKGFYRGHSIPAEVRAEFGRDGRTRTTQDAFLSYFQNFRAEQEYFEPRAAELQAPVLVVWGKYDRFISSKLGEEIAATLPNAQLKIIDKAGHYVHMDKPAELVRVIAKFLEEKSS